MVEFERDRPDLRFRMRDHEVDLSPGLDREAVRAAATREPFEPAALLDELKKNPFVRAQFSSVSSENDAHTIEQHVLMVMGQFERYFADEDLPVDRGVFRVILSLHDIGKAMANREGQELRQTEYNAAIVDRLAPELGWMPAERALARNLVGRDPLGSFVASVGDMSPAAQEHHARIILRMARESSMPAEDFFPLLRMFYLSDAGSYTRDAGFVRQEPTGKSGLDRLFVIDRERRTIDLIPDLRDAVDELEALVYELEDENV